MSPGGGVEDQAPEVAGLEQRRGRSPVAAGGGVAVLWRQCQEAESKVKSLEAELRAEKEARAKDRVTLSRTSSLGETVQDTCPAARRSASGERIDSSLRKVLDEIRLAIADGGDLRRHCAALQASSACGEEAAMRLEERLKKILDEYSLQGAAAAENARSEADTTEQDCNSMKVDETSNDIQEAPLQKCAYEEEAIASRTSTEEKTSTEDPLFTHGFEEIAPLSTSTCSRASPKTSTNSPSPIEFASGKATTRQGSSSTPDLLADVGISSSPPSRSSSSSSPLAPSPLSLLSEAASISPLDVRSPKSLRAHSLSYSGEDICSSKSLRTRSPLLTGEASANSQKVAFGPWSDDAQLLQRFRAQAAASRSLSCAPLLGRAAPRGCRQPHRFRVPQFELDGMNRLPEFVCRRLQKARAQSVGPSV